MRPIARREIEATKLALSLSGKSTEELQQIMLRRDPSRPSRYLHSATMREALDGAYRGLWHCEAWCTQFRDNCPHCKAPDGVTYACGEIVNHETVAETTQQGAPVTDTDVMRALMANEWPSAVVEQMVKIDTREARDARRAIESYVQAHSAPPSSVPQQDALSPTSITSQDVIGALEEWHGWRVGVEASTTQDERIANVVDYLNERLTSRATSSGPRYNLEIHDGRPFMVKHPDGRYVEFA